MTKNTDIKTIKGEIKSFKKEVRLQFKEVRLQFKDVQLQFKDVQLQLHQIETKFDIQAEMFQQWKSEIHDLIDNGFTSKAKAHDEELDILNIRTADTRARLEKLEEVVLNN